MKLAFEAVSQFDDEDKTVAKKVIQSLIMQHHNKRPMADDPQPGKTASSS